MCILRIGATAVLLTTLCCAQTYGSHNGQAVTTHQSFISRDHTSYVVEVDIDDTKHGKTLVCAIKLPSCYMAPAGERGILQADAEPTTYSGLNVLIYWAKIDRYAEYQVQATRKREMGRFSCAFILQDSHRPFILRAVLSETGAPHCAHGTWSIIESDSLRFIQKWAAVTSFH